MALNAKDRPLVPEQSSPEKPSPALALDLATNSTVYLTGWQLQLLSLRSACGVFTFRLPLTTNSSLSLCMLLVNIEVSIIGTSLISITNDLHGFSQMGWVVTGYLITYTDECRLRTPTIFC